MKHFVSCEGEQNFKTEIENVEFNGPTIICWENFRSFFSFLFLYLVCKSVNFFIFFENFSFIILKVLDIYNIF